MAKKKSAKKKRAGRPVGSKTQKHVAENSPSRCLKCKSTERTPYSRTRVIESSGTDPRFGAYTHVVFRVTKCKGCGQARTDRTLENRTKRAMKN